jgi:glycosyltransferase involved in cell wall biosynthesis
VEVGIDGRSLVGAQRGRGVAHYTRALLEALAAEFPDDRWRVLLPASSSAALAASLERHNIAVRHHRLPSRALFGAAAVVRRPRLDRLLGGELDAVWAPAPAPLAVSGRVPLVVTVHDLSFEQRPHDYTGYERLWHRLARPRRLAEQAARIVAVSDATAAVVRERWELAADRVSVVRSGVSAPAKEPTAQAISAARARHGLPERYLLFVGALEPRKAPDLLVRAFERARRAGLDAELAIVGDGRLSPRLHSPGVHLLGALPRVELDALYAGALALVMPSRIEGYGFPPLEALALGTPAVVTDLPVFAETLGESALRFPPGDEEALSGALLRIAADPDLRDRLAAGGRPAVAALTWERAAREMRAALALAAERAPLTK